MTKPATKTVPHAVPDAPAEPPKVRELTPAQKRAIREQARREFKTAERERLAAEAAGPAKADAPTAPATPAPSPLLDVDRSDVERVADAAVFIRGVLMPVVGVLALLFGYRLRLADFTVAMAREDATAWVPICRRYRWLDLVVTWTGAPARLVARVRELAERRPAKEPTT